MNVLTRTLLIGAALSALFFPALPAFPNAAPQPPITREEVTDPETWLTMESEVVDITVKGDQAQVVAKFHFTPVKRNDFSILVMRMGFPELAADRPLEHFAVSQVASINAPESETRSTPSVNITERPAADAWSKSMGVRRWFTWQAEIPPRKRYTWPVALDVEVRYDQALRKVGTGWQSTYVLRTGAPWAGKVSRSTVNLHLDPDLKLVNASPKGYKIDGSTVTYVFENWEPNTDVTFAVKRR